MLATAARHAFGVSVGLAARAVGASRLAQGAGGVVATEGAVVMVG